VQLRCLQAIAANTIGITVPSWLPDALTWLTSALDSHWNGEVYQSVLPGPTDYRAPYDPNIDIVQAAVYGAESATDPRLLATAAQLRAQWDDPASKYYYPINAADAAAGLGPLLGRYPGDRYDGDTDEQAGDHPWALTTANFAELYYRVAARINAAKAVPADSLSAPFLAQVGITPSTTPADAIAALRAAGDAMLQAIVHHSDHLELSEQFDAITGFEKSVASLSWSYAAFLSAVRARRLSAPRARSNSIQQRPGTRPDPAPPAAAGTTAGQPHLTRTMHLPPPLTPARLRAPPPSSIFTGSSESHGGPPHTSHNRSLPPTDESPPLLPGHPARAIKLQGAV
jgi:glucoamylase